MSKRKAPLTNSDAEHFPAEGLKPDSSIVSDVHVQNGGAQVQAESSGVLDTRLLLKCLNTARNGDFSVRLPEDWTGLDGRVADVFNELMANNERLAQEIARVSQVVGVEGKITQRVSLPIAGGQWTEEVKNLNALIENLAQPTVAMARVVEAVSKGDLTQSMPLEWDGRPLEGEFLHTAKTVNTMVERLGSFTSEVTRVAHEVGTEGKLGGQAKVTGATGIWKELVDSVNLMASNLTGQVRTIADVTMAVAAGDLSKKITVDVRGEFLQLKETINTMVDQLRSFASEVTRVAREVGSDGKLGGQAVVPGVAGTWKDLTDSVNRMAANLTGQVRNIADVTTAVARGDLNKKITVEAKGEILELKETINTMVEQLSAFASEVTRVAREVGSEGKLGGQAEVKGVSGTWKDLTDNVNLMASNLTAQVRNIADVTIAVAAGDLSKKITVDVRGEFLQLRETINTMVDQLRSFASEVTRVAREVGSDGKLGGQAVVPGVAGTWKDLTDNVNLMAANLTGQVRNIADVTTAVAKGDLTRKITVDARGEILELKNTVNTMVDQLGSFASEVTRVAREVGSEGKLGGQAEVKGVSGTWKDLTDNVNLMAANLTGQVRNIADVTIAVAAGDLSKKITVDVRGEFLQLKETINTMVDQLRSFASEVTRVAREVGTDGKLGGQAVVPGVGGVWKDLTDNVNGMAANLTGQVRNIADVTTAVAKGDLTRKITVEAKGEIQELKNTINTMVDQLSAFASEVTRVAREVGSEGKLGGQAEVKGVSGTWKDLTDSVNGMAANLTSQVRNIADVTTAVAKGDLTRKITVDAKGEILELKNTVNTMVDQLGSFASEVTRVAREVGTDGKLGGQAVVPGVGGTWKNLTDNVNGMAANLTSQVRNIAQVTTAVANGDLRRKITVDAQGEILELKNTINTMVDQLNSFASEVTRMAREVGTDGKLGGQANVRGAEGIWKDLTDNVNIMASNLTDQVRGIAKVVTGVANGKLTQKFTVQAKGEMATLAETINNLIDTLAIFADQVTSVAREVGVEGKLGGQANVPGAAGTWRDLTDNVNQLAANLTMQVRAIAEVATAVTQGDLSRSITVEARGEVADLKDNVNEMVRNLRETTRQNTEQDWLKTNLAKFTRMLQGQRDMLTVARSLLSELSPLVGAAYGAFYLMEVDPAQPVSDSGPGRLALLASYGFAEHHNLPTAWQIGDGLVGQAAFEKKRILLTNVPGDYVQITSGLGQSTPLSLIVQPVAFEGQVKAVLELASFERFTLGQVSFLEQLTESIGIVLNTIETSSRTEDLLKQSRSMANELQRQQKELQKTNEELEEKASLLAAQNAEVERKNREIDEARIALEEKAEQLAITSKYKSEFLANMSHELRTPLNSLLILSQQLAENTQGNLTEKQVEYSRTIHSAGSDLLNLINDVLDLSKIESGRQSVEPDEVRFTDISDYLDRTFRHVAQSKGLAFEIDLSPNLPRSIITDIKRLQQVIRNLLSNAFKFTEKGEVRLTITPVTEGWSSDSDRLNYAKRVVAFSVSDTGIGIAHDKQKIIFEAFQQADGSTARKYGGTGLGLAISREIGYLLGGELRVVSAPDQGSTFTLYLPLTYTGPETGAIDPDGNRPKPEVVYPAEVQVQPQVKAQVVDAPLSASQSAASPQRIPLAEIDSITDDDRNSLRSDEKFLLIVEDDANFARILLEKARECGFKGIITPRGEDALSLAREYQPAAILLDINLPGIDGWVTLDHLKIDPQTMHIPVHIITVDNDRQHGLEHGALTFINKPISREGLSEVFARMEAFMGHRTRKLLVVEDDDRDRYAIVEMLQADDVQIKDVATGREALEALQNEHFDCMVLDLRLPDAGEYPVLEMLQKTPALRSLPVVVYTGVDLTRSEEDRLRKTAQSVIIKGARSPERLLAETSLFLHRVAADLPPEKRRTLEQIYQSDSVLQSKTVLVVDDDVRNIFALTAALEQHGMTVISAENGRTALEILGANPKIDIVLMDIMMPEMDGYETTIAIRKQPQFKALPIIALTAKAMKGDREKCMAAGTSDYVAKPVKMDQLLSLMRVWLYS